MPRPRNTVRTINVHLMLPEDLMSQVYALLHSDLEGRVPFGAQAKFFERAARDLLARLQQEGVAHGS